MESSALLIGNFLSNKGASRGVCEDLATRLEGRDWRVVTASSRRRKLNRLMDMIVTAVKNRHLYNVAHVDVYSGPAFFWAEAVCLVLRWLGKPYVLTLHGGNLPNFASQYPVRVRRLLNSARIVTAPSAYLNTALKDYHSSIRILPNPIEISAYPYRERRSVQPKLVWLRAFHSIYNPVMAVEVLAALAPKFPGITLTMVGPDKGDGTLQRTQAAVVSLGLQNLVTFLGPVSKGDVPQVLSQADIFLNTTNFDNTPVSVIEAMACGLCVVTTRVGGTSFLVRHEVDGLVVHPGNVDSMGVGVARLIRDGVFAHRCSSNAREKVQKWDWSFLIVEWDRLLRSAMGQSLEKHPPG